jgi:two-component system phosphate regulon response regulator OmpR
VAEETHILVVDDDPRVRDLLCDYLEDEGYRLTGAANGEAMRACFAEVPVNLVILDLNLPGEDGLTLAREIRATSEVPIIIVTGKGDVIDRVTGLEVGADDYIAKPFELREVLARVRAVLRRSKGDSDPAREPAAQASEIGQGWCFAEWQLDPIRRILLASDGAPVELTTGEYELLFTLVTHPNRVLNRDQIMDLVHGRDWNPFDRSIDTQIGRLRKKIEPDPKHPSLIKTVRGAGYIFTPEVKPLG